MGLCNKTKNRASLVPAGHGFDVSAQGWIRASPLVPFSGYIVSFRLGLEDTSRE